MKIKNGIFLSIITLLLFMQSGICQTNDELREKAKLLYLGQQPAEARQQILLIPANQRTAEDYFLMGLTGQKPLQITKPYENAAEKKPDFYPAYYNLGEYYFSLNNYEKAAFYYKKAIKYNKNLDYSYYNLGCVYLKTEQYNKAKQCFEKAIELKPEEPDYYYNLGYTYTKLNNPKKAEKATELYNELINKRNEY